MCIYFCTDLKGIQHLAEKSWAQYVRNPLLFHFLKKFEDAFSIFFTHTVQHVPNDEY